MGMSKRQADLGLALAGVCTSIFFALQIADIPVRTFGDPLGARLLPLAVICVLGLLSASLAIQSLFFPSADASGLVDGGSSRPWHVALLLLAACLYVLLMPFLGYYVVSWLLALLVLVIGRPGPIIAHLVTATGIVLIFFAVFDYGLRVPLPRGDIWEFL